MLVFQVTALMCLIFSKGAMKGMPLQQVISAYRSKCELSKEGHRSKGKQVKFCLDTKSKQQPGRQGITAFTFCSYFYYLFSQDLHQYFPLSQMHKYVRQAYKRLPEMILRAVKMRVLSCPLEGQTTYVPANPQSSV